MLCFSLAISFPWELDTSMPLAVALLPMTCPDIETLPSSQDTWLLCFELLCRLRLKPARRLRRPLETPIWASGGSRPVSQHPVLLGRQVLGFSPPHLFRSKSSYLTKSKDTALSIISFHHSDLLSDWILRESAFKPTIWSWIGHVWVFRFEFTFPTSLPF